MYRNNRTLRALAIMLAAATALAAFCGCSAVITDPVVAKVGDVEITYSAFYNAFSQYSQYGVIDTTDAVTIAQGRDMIMGMLVDSAVPVAQAHAQGITLTEEEMTSAKESAAASAERYLASFLDKTIEDEDARREAAIKAFDAAYEKRDITYASLLADMEKEYMNNVQGQKLIADLYSTIAAPTDAEIQARYDKELAEDRKAYAADAKKYNTDMNSYSYYGGLKPLVAPEGLYYVKHILIKNAENADKDKKDRDYKKLAEEVLAKVKEGADFDALIEEYNEDIGMKSHPEGYIFSPDFTGVYDEAFQKAGAELKAEGDVSGLVEGTYGIHIIKRMGNVSTDAIPLDEVKDDVKNLILTEKQSELYKSQLEVWKQGLRIKTYDKRVQYVGVR